VWLMQLEVQSTTRGILAVSAGALKVLLQYIWRFRSSRTFNVSQDMDALKDLVKTVDGLKYSVQASSILDSHDVADQPSTATTNAALLAKVKLVAMLL